VEYPWPFTLLPPMRLKRKKKTIATINQFLLLTIEVFGYLHKYVYVFLHDCANVIWSLKGSKDPHFHVLIICFHQKNSITLRQMQAFFILSHAVTIGLAIS
jgi:hypothetical protein